MENFKIKFSVWLENKLKASDSVSLRSNVRMMVIFRGLELSYASHAFGIAQPRIALQFYPVPRFARSCVSLRLEIKQKEPTKKPRLSTWFFVGSPCWT